jgi:transposase InsO family protein
MPFQETCRMEERIAMFRDWDSGAFTASEVAALYGVSRETFYVWRRRRESHEECWFDEHSRAPRSCPHATPAEEIAAIVAMRKRFPRFGPKKIRAKLVVARPRVDWPAASTIGDILKREGLVTSRNWRRRPVAVGASFAEALEPNAEWSIDFKGWFRTRDGERCDPLTVEDTATRYLLDTRIMEPTHPCVLAALQRLFAEKGLPQAIRSDNGPPFGTTGPGGLSRLSVWWLKLGIEPHYTRPASPQDNGRHERMHRTLREQTAKPPADSKVEQQARFDAFCRHYNEERPHEALAQTPPAAHWRPSVRQLPQHLAEPWYEADYEPRRVRRRGTIKWRGEEVFLGEALAGELVGLAELENGGHIVRFCSRDLGLIDRASRFHSFAPPRSRLRCAAEPRDNQSVRDAAGPNCQE